MLAAERRLRRREEFTSVVRGGRRAGRGCLVVHAIAAGTVAVAGDGSVSRAGFVIPRTVGTAVVRNRVRRRLRHLVSDRLAQLPAGTCVVIRVLPTAGSRTYDELAVSLDAALAAVVRADSRGSRPSGS